jgi:hypothetical protein
LPHIPHIEQYFTASNIICGLVIGVSDRRRCRWRLPGSVGRHQHDHIYVNDSLGFQITSGTPPSLGDSVRSLSIRQEDKPRGHLAPLPWCPGGALEGHRHSGNIFNCWSPSMFTIGLFSTLTYVAYKQAGDRSCKPIHLHGLVCEENSLLTPIAKGG